MLITGIKSRPIYDHLVPMPRAKRHIIAAQGSGGKAITRLLIQMTASQRAASELLYSRESFSGNDCSSKLLEFDCAYRQIFERNENLISTLANRLDKAEIGTVLYLAGSETFIGCAMQVATQHDLNSDEVLREHCGTLARRVVCIHCNALNDNVTRRVFRCSSCGEILVVRDHYSRMWAAFMGVKADSEMPGVLPPDEELDT